MSHCRESWLPPLVLSGVMLRNRALVLLTTLSFVSQIVTEQMVYSDGWIPMSHNDIYNQIRRESTEYPVYFTTKPPLDYDNTFNLLQRDINTKKDFRDIRESLEIVNEQPFDIIAKEYVTDKFDKVSEEGVKDNSRKAKKVWRSLLNVNENNMVPIAEPKSDAKENSASNEIITATTSNTYEVTENTDKFMATEDNNITENVGYQYKLIDQNQNVTSTLYKILSKYNINTYDELPNYDLSLRKKVQNPMENGHRIPLPYRYNSLNHLPVDPLVAVFLSNYGFYLPSLYGIKSNYNNLYSYLASNNIHNNKPFGLYKIFSDTDSWN